MGGEGGATLDKEHKIKGQEPWNADPRTSQCETAYWIDRNLSLEE